MLRVDSVHAGYGGTLVLFGLSLEVDEGEVVALMGRNGMGKTTTVLSMMGALRVRSGSVHFRGRRIDGLAPYRIAKLGIGLVPEGRQVFPTLSVRENLLATAANYGGLAEPWDLDRVFELFPALKSRAAQPGGTLSGGEQQMLAIGRALMLCPRLLVLDEATEGLAPLIREEIWRCLARLKALGHSILLIDKNLEELAPIADRTYVMEKGAVVWQGATTALLADEALQRRHLGL